MISMARIQGSAMGYAGFQKPIVQLGQDSFAPGPIGAGVTPPAAPVFQPVLPPNYAFPVVEQPVVTTTPAALPTWAIVGLAAVAGAVVAGLVMNR
jgi:hypothetical protein